MLAAMSLNMSDSSAAQLLAEARRATERRDFAAAASQLQSAHERYPLDREVAIQLALALGAQGRLQEALVPLEALIEREPEQPTVWLYAHLLLDRMGDKARGLKAAYQAVTRAQRAGLWVDEASTPQDLLRPVLAAVERVRLGRRELFMESFATLREQHGNAELARMDRALANYLSPEPGLPPDSRQRPTFFYFPGLPDSPYHEPALQPWAHQLRAAFPEIRREALSVLEEDRVVLPDFIPRAGTNEHRPEHLAGASLNPTWQAFFFYRRGRRFDDNHARCPATSQALESIDLCRIGMQAPEICFSVLRPQTHIKAHHGVSNIRLVMHLPLIVPHDCALNLVGAGEHAWREGELVMFDDTYLHEAWNRSDATRVIVLMDCWNPYLTPVEREACARLIETIGSLRAAAR